MSKKTFSFSFLGKICIHLFKTLSDSFSSCLNRQTFSGTSDFLIFKQTGLLKVTEWGFNSSKEDYFLKIGKDTVNYFQLFPTKHWSFDSPNQDEKLTAYYHSN
jgi:hypothetical protein